MVEDFPTVELMLPIETRRLLLRDFKRSDFAALHAFASDPEVTRYTSFGPNTEDETQRFLYAAVAESSQDPRDTYSLAVELRDGSQVIGSCGLAKPNHKQYEIGYVLAKSYWNRGLATELVEALVEFAVSQLRADKLWAPVDARNGASSRVLEKVGFRQEGLLRRDRLKWPEGRDTRLFGLLAEEWPQSNIHNH